MGTHPIFESDFDCLTENSLVLMNEVGLKIGESSTFPTDIFLKVCRTKRMRAVRLTNCEKLTLEEIKALSREILIQRKLRSPYIVEVLSCRVVGFQLAVESAYCAYGSCSDIIHAHFHHGFEFQTVSLIARGVALALDYLHQSGVIHRSVRASHVLVTDTGGVKLGGFRHALELAHTDRHKRAHTYTYDSQGIPWKAPELLEQNCAGYDSKVDIYSFGILICELFNGSAPFLDLEEPTLIMLEKLRGKQPLLMDKSTLESAGQNGQYAEDRYDPYWKRKIPKTWHLLVAALTTRPPHKRPAAKIILKHNALKFAQGSLVEKLEPVRPIQDIQEGIEPSTLPDMSDCLPESGSVQWED